MTTASENAKAWIDQNEAQRLAELEEQIKMAQPWDMPDIFDSPPPANDEAEALEMAQLLRICSWMLIAIVLGVCVWGLFRLP